MQDKNQPKAAQAETQATWLQRSGGLSEATVKSGNSTFEPFWQIRVSIKPTYENSLGATSALSKLNQFKEKPHPSYKIWQIPEGQGVQAGWDGCLTGSDRDQRGKEICIYMEHLDGNYPDYYDPETGYPKVEYLKDLMIDTWKALEEEGVEFSYITPGKSEKEVICEDMSNTPFSYSSFKPYKGRHGILHSTEYNPMKLHDPLAELKITSNDLANAGITRLTAVNSLKRIEYQVLHYQQYKFEIEDEMMNILIHPNPSQTISPEEKAKFKEEFSKVRPDLNDAQIDKLISNDPARMKIIYRKMVHLSHENEAILHEAMRCSEQLKAESKNGKDLKIDPLTILSIPLDVENKKGFSFKDKLNTIKINKEISNIVSDCKSGKICKIEIMIERLEILKNKYPDNASLTSKIEHIKLKQVELNLPKIMELHTMASNNRSNSSSNFKERLKEFTPDVEQRIETDNQNDTPPAP